MIPCGFRKNTEFFEPGDDGPSKPYPLFPYLSSDLATFGQVFWKEFTQNFLPGNAVLAPVFGDDWSAPVQVSTIEVSNCLTIDSFDEFDFI